MKLEVERNVERSPVPWTILRATQFHELVLRINRFLDRLPVMAIPNGFLFQSIETGEVTDRLAELALSEPAGRVPDIGGPEIRTFGSCALLLEGDRTTEEGGGGPVAWQDGACVSRGRANVSGPGLRKDPVGGVPERNGQSCRTEDVRR
jgi:hypothetical protein